MESVNQSWIPIIVPTFAPPFVDVKKRNAGVGLMQMAAGCLIFASLKTKNAPMASIRMDGSIEYL